MKKLVIGLIVLVAIGFNLSYDLVNTNSKETSTNLRLENLKAVADLGDEGDGSGGEGNMCWYYYRSCSFYGCYYITYCTGCTTVSADYWSHGWTDC